MSKFQKGHKSYERTPEWRKKMSERLKKNPINYWLGKKRPDMLGNKFNTPLYGKDNIFSKIKFIGKDHAKWKGDDVGYDALHRWVYRNLGKPSKCEFCEKIEERSSYIHWANKSGEYKRDLADWLRLCAKCHYHYDREGIR